MIVDQADTGHREEPGGARSRAGGELGLIQGFLEEMVGRSSPELEPNLRWAVTMPPTQEGYALRRIALTLALVLVAAGCGGDDDVADTTTAPVTTEAATTTTTAPPETTTTTAPPETTEAASADPYSAWIDVFAVPGNCVTITYNAAGDDADYAVAPDVVDCDEPHGHQVYFVGEYPSDASEPYPDFDTLAEVVFDENCAEPLVDTAGADYETITLDIWGFWPTESAWDTGERTFACSVANVDDAADDDMRLVGALSPAGLVLPNHLMVVVAEFEESDLWLYTFGPEGEVLEIVNITGDGADFSKRRTPPSWSPDLTKIVYAAEHSDGNGDLFLVDLATGEKTQLTDNPANDGGPTFSPDGTKILFSSDRNGSELDLFVMDVDGSNVVQLTDNPDRESSGDWSPDGSQIVYRQRTDGQSDIWIMNADGTDQRYFRGGAGNEYDPDWSPDGNRILYITDDTANGAFDIMVAPVDGDGATNLTDHPASDEYPEWSPDGEYVIFNSDRHGYQGLFIMRADGSDQSALVWSYPVGYAQVVLSAS